MPKKATRPKIKRSAPKILASADGPMTTKELIDAMAAKGLWKSPDGKTPERSLNSAITS